METLFESDALECLIIPIAISTAYSSTVDNQAGRVCNLPSRCEPSRQASRQSGTFFSLAMPEVGRGRTDVASQGLTVLLLVVPLCAVLSLASTTMPLVITCAAARSTREI